jgi:hypothetical protein
VTRAPPPPVLHGPNPSFFRVGSYPVRYSTVIVNVGNSNEAPIVSNYVLTIDENSPVGSINSQVGAAVLQSLGGHVA